MSLHHVALPHQLAIHTFHFCSQLPASVSFDRPLFHLCHKAPTALGGTQDPLIYNNISSEPRKPEESAIEYNHVLPVRKLQWKRTGQKWAKVHSYRKYNPQFCMFCSSNVAFNLKVLHLQCYFLFSKATLVFRNISVFKKHV